MKNTYYKTTSWGGIDGWTVVTRYFDTEENARKYAKTHAENTDYEFFKCTATVEEHGMYKITEEKIG